MDKTSFLSSILERAGNEYYNRGSFLKIDADTSLLLSSLVSTPAHLSGLESVTDALYDFLEDELRKDDPDNPILKRVGAPVDKKKAKLPVQMSGLGKMTVGDSSVASFANSCHGPYVVSDKLDGVSIQIEYSASGGVRAYTRGDGVYGEDISYMVRYLKLPKASPYSNVRGEVVMRRDVFASKWSSSYENARNLVAGKINAKTIHEAVYDMDVVVYGVLSDGSEKPSSQLEKLQSAGFNVVDRVVLSAIDESTLSSLLKERKTASPYDLDGIVVVEDREGLVHTVDSPEWARKFKENTDFYEVTAVGCLYDPSKDGYLKPTISITPTRIAGVTVTNVTAFNHKFIVDNHIGPGSKLLVTRSGDVIPHISRVLSPAPGNAFEPSEPWVWNDTGVDAVVTDPDSHPAVRIRRICFFFGTLGVDELGRSSFEKVVAAGFDSVDKIVKMTLEDWKSIDGFAGKRGEICHTEMRKCLSSVYLPDLADATGFFGRGFGSTRFEAILNEHPDLMTANLTRDSAYLLAISTKGIGQTTAAQFADGIEKFVPWLRSMTDPPHRYIKLVEPEKTAVVGDALVGQKITFTGFRNPEWQRVIESHGGEVVDFGKKTTLLVYGGKKSGKVDAAAKKGVKTASQGEFAEVIEGLGDLSR